MTIPTISITDITSSPEHGIGTGVFDLLYATVKKEVTEQFTSGKLRGSEYAEVVLGSLTATLNQSIQFLMTKDELNYKLQLLELQKEAQKIENQKLLIEKDILEINKDLALLQKDEVTVKIELMNLEKITVGKQQLLLDKQVLSEEQKRLNMGQELIQIQAQKDVLLQQKANLLIEADKLTQEVGLTENNKLIAAEQKFVVTETKNKTIAETNLLNAKITSELAQTAGTPGGVLGKQMELYEAQREGFVKDALQKKAKIASDVWAVARTTDSDATALPLTIAEIGNMIKAAG